MTNKRQVFLHPESKDFYVYILGGFVLTGDYVDQGGIVEKGMDNMVPLGSFSDREIEEMFS